MADFFIRRPIVAIVIAIITIIAGLVAMSGLPVAQYPAVVPPVVSVSAGYGGADALTIEQSVAAPLEQQMNGVDHMLYMQSTNASDGSMSLAVTFDVESDVDTDQVNVQNRVSQASASLPSDVNQNGVTIQKSMGLPLLVMSLYSPKGTYDDLFLGNYATINMNDALYRVAGVGKVNVMGGSEYAMRVWVKPDKLAKLGLTIPELAHAIQSQSSVNPAGKVGAEPVPPGQEFTYTVRSRGRLVTAEEFGEVIVRLNPNGSMVRLKDVARLELGALAYGSVGRFDGKPAAIIAVSQTPGSNALSVAAGVKAAMEELKTRFPDDLDYMVSLDTTTPVSEGLKEIVITLFEAMVLVIVVVYLFLQNWRATLIPMVAVPVSLIGTFAVFPLLGFSINTLSLLGLILAIGLVVDDAIVVVEAVEHQIEKGLSPREATSKAMREVTGPVIGIALILSAVFIPVAFMGGIQGRLNKQFAVTIAVSVLISAFNALTLSPALSAMLLRPRKAGRGPVAAFFRAFNRWFDTLTTGYVRVSGGLVRKAFVTVVILVAFSAGAGKFGLSLPSSFVPEEDQGYFFVHVQLPDAASVQRTDAVCRKIDAVLSTFEGVAHYNTVAGSNMLSGTAATNAALYFISLDPWDERKGEGMSAAALAQTLSQTLQSVVVEGMAFAFLPPAIAGLGQSGGFSFWLQDRSGGDIALLAEHVERFIAATQKRPELAGVNTMFRAGVPQVYADVDQDKVLKLGVEVGDVYLTMQAFLGGLYVNQFNRFGRQWRVFLQAEGESRTKSEDLGSFFVNNRAGAMVPLSTLVRAKPSTGPEYTNRFNLYRSAQIMGSAAPGYSSGQAMAALEEVAREVLPREIGYDWADLSYQERKAAGGSGVVFGLSLVFVFLILAALYESWTLPFSVLLSVPVAVFGAFLGLYLRNLDIDVFAQIGLVMLIGLAAKNAILIVEFAKAEFEKGRSLADAALEGARLRLRPILMTSFAFVLGCVPLWTATGAGAVSRRVIGTVVISGMGAATVIAIFIIPALFVIVEKIGGVERRRPSDAEPQVASAPVGGGH